MPRPHQQVHQASWPNSSAPSATFCLAVSLSPSLTSSTRTTAHLTLAPPLFLPLPLAAPTRRQTCSVRTRSSRDRPTSRLAHSKALSHHEPLDPEEFGPLLSVGCEKSTTLTKALQFSHPGRVSGLGVGGSYYQITAHSVSSRCAEHRLRAPPLRNLLQVKPSRCACEKPLSS